MTSEKIKVLLVSAGPVNMGYPFRSHPLGLMYLAAYARRELPGAEFRVMDTKVSPCSPRRVGEIAAEWGADVVGLTALTVHSREMAEMAAEAKRSNPGALVIAGGPHATCFPERLIDAGSFDAIVAGEGEKPFTAILKARMSGAAIDGIKSVVTQNKRDGIERDAIENPDDIPFPAWDLIDAQSYFNQPGFTILGKRRYMSMFTSRACPYSCIYCHNIFGRHFRPRSAENVLEEMRRVEKDFGIRDFDILDDVFNLNRERVVKICETLISEKRNVKFAFPNGLRSDLLDREIILLLRRAGASYISFAIETASPRLQKMISKNLNLPRAAEAIRIASKAGILCNGFMMLGFPTETEAELRRTIHFAVKSPLQVAHFLRVTPFEGTGLHDMLSDEKKKYLSEHPEFMSYEDRNINLSEIPDSRFRLLFRYALLRFYLNPLRFFAILKRHPEKKNLVGFIPVAIKRLFING